MVIYVLLFTIFLLILWFYFILGLNLLSPAMAFTLPFGIAVIDLIFNIQRWSVELQWNTFFVILGGILSFFLGSEIVRVTYSKKRLNRQLSTQNVMTEQSEMLPPLKIQNIASILFLLFQIFSFVFCLYAIMRVAARNGYGGSIMSRIAGYKYLSSHTTRNISLGRLGNVLYLFCTASGYVWIYILSYQLACSKRVQAVVVFNLVASIALDLIKGGRQSTIQLIFAGAAIFLLLQMALKKRNRLTFKQVMFIALGVVLLVASFQWIGALFGRKTGATFSHYIAIYLSAPIYNLDHFLRQTFHYPSVFGKMTFIRIINYIGGKLDIAKWIYPLDLPYLRANGSSTGNVYTTFYAYYYDFGYLGVAIMPFIIGTVSQILYEKARSIVRNKDGRLHLIMIVYGYVYYTLVFSFFSNKFFEGVVSNTFVSRLVYWVLIIWFLEHVRIYFRNRN